MLQALLTEESVPLVVGRREAEERRVSVRRLGSQASTGMELDQALALLADEGTELDVRRAQARRGKCGRQRNEAD